uniref:Pyridoxal phosphate homeostasis protein n=1 Tax=Romanomermis culicivorax TaxID=13658 RepID=A0A915HZ07_ROMCU
MGEISANLMSISKQIAVLANQTEPIFKTKFPRLVAVSKTKPIRDILEAYESGQRYFGENYVQELIDKANDSIILEKCPDIRWHFIGNLQSNKVNKICSKVPNLECVETVDSSHLAELLNKALDRESKALRVFVQVNTSREDQKNGTDIDDALDLVDFIKTSCPKLNFSGFMTIGSLGQSLDQEKNDEFRILRTLREKYCVNCSVPIENVELSMGMSSDFEVAIKMGSTNVRVGSAIFGNRDLKS